MSAVKFLVMILGCACATPLPSTSHVQYDQRQDGEINVRADLENFVILVIPASSPNSGLLDLLSKAVPLKSLKRRKPVKDDDDLDTQNFIESKTAPYHVDITKSRSDLRPDVEKSEELLIARSNQRNDGGHPARKGVDVEGRYAKAFLVTIPVDDEKEDVTGELLLLGAENEQCGPGGRRDEKGICRFARS